MSLQILQQWYCCCSCTFFLQQYGVALDAPFFFLQQSGAVAIAAPFFSQFTTEPVRYSSSLIQAREQVQLIQYFSYMSIELLNLCFFLWLTSIPIVAADWWFQFGGEVPTLQKYALRIVSQCVSSSGCERNWSTFALVHTKIRNKLGYDKLHKLVYVHYNLKERIRGNSGYQQKDKEVDPCSMMLDAAIFDENNPIWDWLDRSMNDVGPRLDDLCQSQLGNSSRGKRAREFEDEEIEFELGESDEEHNEDEFDEDLAEGDDDSDDEDNCDDDEAVQTAPSVEEDIEALGEEDGNPNSRRSGRLKWMRTQSLSTLYERE